MVEAEVRHKDGGHADAAIGLLIVLKDSDHGTANGDSGAVEGVDKLILPIAILIAHVEATTLEIGTVTGTGNFAPIAMFATTGHPRLQIILAVGWRAQISDRRIYDAKGDVKTDKDLLFNIA